MGTIGPDCHRDHMGNYQSATTCDESSPTRGACQHLLRYGHSYIQAFTSTLSCVHASMAYRTCRVTGTGWQGTAKVVAGERRCADNGPLTCARLNGLRTGGRPGADPGKRSQTWERGCMPLDHNCPCLRLDEAIGSRSAVTHAKEVRLAPGIILQAAHPSPRPTFIGLEAPIVASVDWRIYRHRAYCRFQLSSLPSLLFTSMPSPHRSLRHS
jgi:hypothetical protein